MTDTKILIIDDDSNVTELLKSYFANEGYDIKVATDGSFPKRTAGRFAAQFAKFPPNPLFLLPPRVMRSIPFSALNWGLTILLQSLLT